MSKINNTMDRSFSYLTRNRGSEVGCQLFWNMPMSDLMQFTRSTGLCRPHSITASLPSTVSGVDSYIELTSFESKLASCVLECCMDQLNVLGQFDVETIMQSTIITDLKKSLRQKYGRSHHKNMYDPQTLQISEDSASSYIADKYKRELMFLVQLINCVKNDVKITRMCDTLQECIYYYLRRKKIERNILRRYEMNEYQLTNLNSMFEIDKKRYKERIDYLDKRIIIRQNMEHDEMIIKGVKTRMCDKYEKARGEQMHKKIVDKESDLKKLIKELRKKIEWENRVHGEITKYLIDTTAIVQKQVVESSDKYDREIEGFEDLLIDANLNGVIMKEGLKRMQTEFERRKTAIDHYTVMKQTRKMLELRQSSAGALQAWWRAEVFRNKLIGRNAKGKEKSGRKTKR